MKRFKIVAAAVLAAIVLSFSGCTTKIQVIDDSSKTNAVHNVSSGFNEETYIWESWLFGTNRVDKW